MTCFKDRLITVMNSSPLHPIEIAVVELMTVKESFEGAISLRDLDLFAGLLALHPSEMFVREQGENKLELWLVNDDPRDFDDDPTPVDLRLDT